MNAATAYELINKYSQCPKCGRDTIENDTGVIEIKDGCFKRTCPCGWSVEVKEEDLKV